jgi:hypothetical protein
LDALKPPLDCLMEAKAAREVVRDALVKTIRRNGVTAEEIDGLLCADKLATENLRLAQEAYDRQIPDSHAAP